MHKPSLKIQSSGFIEMEKRSFALHKTPVYIMYVLGFIIYDNPRRKWIHKSLRITTIIIYTTALISQILFSIEFSKENLDTSLSGLLLYYSSHVSQLFKIFFLLLFVWKSICSKQIQAFLGTLMQSLHSSVKLKYTSAILLQTSLCIISPALTISLIIKYIYMEMFFEEERKHVFVAKILAAILGLYSFLFFPLFCSFVAFVCLQLCSLLESLKLSLENKIKSSDMNSRNSFLQFSENFYEIKQLFTTFENLFSFDFACFLALCINDLVVNFFLGLYLGRCGFSAGMLKAVVGVSVLNFFLFVTPCCHLDSQVRRPDICLTLNSTDKELLN